MVQKREDKRENKDHQKQQHVRSRFSVVGLWTAAGLQYALRRFTTSVEQDILGNIVATAEAVVDYTEHRCAKSVAPTGDNAIPGNTSY